MSAKLQWQRKKGPGKLVRTHAAGRAPSSLYVQKVGANYVAQAFLFTEDIVIDSKHATMKEAKTWLEKLWTDYQRRVASRAREQSERESSQRRLSDVYSRDMEEMRGRIRALRESLRAISNKAMLLTEAIEAALLQDKKRQVVVVVDDF